MPQAQTKNPLRRDGRARPQTKERLLQAATEVFAEKGYYATAVDDIVHVSGTSKGSFYNFFPNKQSIFMALVDRVNRLMVERVEAAIQNERGALNKVDVALQAVIEHFSRHRRLARILLIEAAGLGHSFNEKLFDLHKSFSQLIKKYLDQAVSEGSIPPLETELAAYVWLGAINEVVMRWLHTGEPEKLHDVIPHLRLYLLRSIDAPVVRSDQS